MTKLYAVVGLRSKLEEGLWQSAQISFCVPQTTTHAPTSPRNGRKMVAPRRKPGGHSA